MPARYFEYMGIAFNTVLVPVDFSANTETAIKKTMVLTENARITLHLLHVTSGRVSLTEWNATRRLEYLACRIREQYPGVKVKTHVLRGHFVQREIVRLAMELGTDLIVIGKQDKFRRWRALWNVSPGAVARKTGCSVLTVRPGGGHERVKIIVIPISSSQPERKLEWGIMLARMFKAQIHLLALDEGNMAGQMPGVFIRWYHYLRESLWLPVEFATSHLHNPAKAAMNYAEMVKADMVLVNSEKESWVSRLGWCRHISDLPEKDSGIQVLEISG